MEKQQPIQNKLDCINIWIALRCAAIYLGRFTFIGARMNRNKRLVCADEADVRCSPNQVPTHSVAYSPIHLCYSTNDDPQRNSHQNGKNYYIKNSNEIWYYKTTTTAKKTLNLKWTMQYVLCLQQSNSVCAHMHHSAAKAGITFVANTVTNVHVHNACMQTTIYERKISIRYNK